MAERIKPRVVEGKGTATEILYEFHGRFARQTEGEVYYHLVDKTQISTVRRLNDGVILTLPYKILFSEKIKVIGNDLANLKVNSAYAKNIAFTRSPEEEEEGTSTYKYFAVANRMSRTGQDSGRRKIDGNGYELYEKQSLSRLGLNTYTLLTSYAGDPVGNPIKDKYGNITGYDKPQLSYNAGLGIIDIEVTIRNTGEKAYAISPNSRGDNFYINIIQPYL
jgi:hypothetical protein